MERHANLKSRIPSPISLAPPSSHRTILINKSNIPGPLSIPPHKLLIPRRALRPRVPRQHTLNTHTHALDILHGAPALGPEEIEAYYAVAVDMGMEGDGAGGLGEGEEGYFGCFCRVYVSFGARRGLGWPKGEVKWGWRTNGVVGAEAETEAVSGV